MTAIILPEMTVSGAILILAAILIRSIVRDRLPRETYLALWGLALARLLVPFSLPSPSSIYNLAESRGRGISLAPDSSVLPAAAAAAEQADGPSVPLAGIWLAGALVCALVFLTAWFRCRREFAASLPAEDDFSLRFLADHRLRRHVRLRQSDRIASPLTYGVLRPVILMPRSTDWSDHGALTCVLTHELVHIRRLDAVWKLLFSAAACVHWFNPLVWAMYRMANRDLELSCDRQVLRRLGPERRKDYASALITFEERKYGPSPFSSGFGITPIEERISAIMRFKKASLLSMVLALLVVTGTAALLATSAQAENVQPAPQDQTAALRHHVPDGCPDNCYPDDCPDGYCPDDSVCAPVNDDSRTFITAQPVTSPSYPVQFSGHHSETHHTESHGGHHGGRHA